MTKEKDAAPAKAKKAPAKAKKAPAKAKKAPAKAVNPVAAWIGENEATKLLKLNAAQADAVKRAGDTLARDWPGCTVERVRIRHYAIGVDLIRENGARARLSFQV